MPIYSSDSDSDHQTLAPRPFECVHGGTMHMLLEGGRAAYQILWRNKNISAPILIGMTLILFISEVYEYHFLTLVCQISITAMLLIFIWCYFHILVIHDWATGKDLTGFILTIAILWILSVIESYFNVFYLGFIGMAALPILYGPYQKVVDFFVAGRGNKVLKKLYKKFDAITG